jgi:hypothetical protein
MAAITTASEILDLPSYTRQAMYVYYYQCEEYIKKNPGIPLDLLAAAAVNLACKHTGLVRKLRDIVNVFYYIEHKRYLEINDLFWKLKDSVIQAEYALLRILHFDTEVPNAFVELIDLVREETDRVYMQTSWACLNDLLSLDRICEIQLDKSHFGGKLIALGAMWMGMKLMGRNVPIREWCERYQTRDHEIILEIATLGMKQYQSIYRQHH